MSVFGMKITNSSPPNRAKISDFRIIFLCQFSALFSLHRLQQTAPICHLHV